MQYLFHLPIHVGHWVCLFVGWWTYVWHWVCLLFLEIMLGIGFVCLFVGWVTYVWHCVWLLFVEIMLGIGFVCWLGDLSLVMVGLF